jgi:hypothetical protein
LTRGCHPGQLAAEVTMRTNRPDWNSFWKEMGNPPQVWSFGTFASSLPPPVKRPEKIVLMHQDDLEPIAILPFPAGTTAMLREAALRVEIMLLGPEVYGAYLETPALTLRRALIKRDFFRRKDVEHPFLFALDYPRSGEHSPEVARQLADDIAAAFRATVPSERRASIERAMNAPKSTGFTAPGKAVTQRYREMIREHYSGMHNAISTPVPPSPPSTPAPPKLLRVLFDGVPWQGVVNAKEGREGWIEAMVTGEDGQPVLKDGRPVTERLGGRVEIIPDRK